eukprot:6393-Heterococcus_DN1.PRE.1
MRAHTTYNTGKLCNAPQVSAAPHQSLSCQLVSCRMPAQRAVPVIRTVVQSLAASPSAESSPLLASPIANGALVGAALGAA